jgi:hypothetical protein
VVDPRLEVELVIVVLHLRRLLLRPWVGILRVRLPLIAEPLIKVNGLLMDLLVFKLGIMHPITRRLREKVLEITPQTPVSDDLRHQLVVEIVAFG